MSTLTKQQQEELVGVQEDIEACLDYVNFQNDQFFTNAMFYETSRKINFKGIGKMIDPCPGLFYKLSGTWENNPKYGFQFNFQYAITLKPLQIHEIKLYITNKCKGIGMMLSQTLVDKYGVETLDIMRKEPVRVSQEISGISESMAVEIASHLNSEIKYEVTMAKLGGILNIPGMRKNVVKLLIEDFGHLAPERLKKNPYLLTQYPGVGFELADKVAINIGFPRTSLFRKEAAIKHVLTTDTFQGGSVWMDKNKLLKDATALIQVPGIQEGLNAQILEGEVVEDGNSVALEKYHKHEVNVAKKIILLTH